MKIEFRYKASYDIQKAYLRFHLFRHQKIHINNLLVSIFLIAFALYAMQKQDYLLVTASALLFVVVNLILAGMLYKIYKTNLWSKNFHRIDELVVTLEKDRILIHNEETNEQANLAFEDVYRIYDLKNHIFIYLTESQAVCLEKSQIIEGDLDTYLVELDESENHTKYRKR